jgi:hypothetical protein
MPQERSPLDRELHALEAELKRLEAEYNQFFAGRLPRLPWDQRSRVEALMKRYDRMYIQNTGDRFRFQTIQSRWAAFNELWERQMRAQEQGRRTTGRPRGLARPPADAPSRTRRDRGTPPAAPVDTAVSVTSLSDPGAQTDRVQALYEQLAEARRQSGEKPVEFDRFAELVKAQVRKHGTGGRAVAFQVTVKDGKVTLTATAEGES